MPRPRKASDEAILGAVVSVMMKRGPTDWTLADVAAHVGLTAGALVQRFGSKRALQVILAGQFADGMPAMLDGLRQAHPSPLAALRAYAANMACLAETPEMLAHHLAYLRLDLTDPDLHKHFRRQSEAGRAFIRSLLDAAIEAGELPAVTDAAALARAVEVTITGSLFTWGAYQEGTAGEWMRRDLDALLGTVTKP